MLQRMLIVSALTSVLVFSAVLALAVDQELTQQKVQAQTQEQAQIYGSQLMTKQERAEYRARMQAAKTAEERERIRKEHHERMKLRAKERGVALPEDPFDRGMGRGMGPGGSAELGGGRGAGGDGLPGGGGGLGGGRNR